jgi:hypothetical protein
MPNFTLDNITLLTTEPMPWPLGWRITFSSTNTDKVHQLYINRQLADWTHQTSQRAFTLPSSSHRQRIIIAAVSQADRQTDFSSLLPIEEPDSHFFQTRVTRSPNYDRASRLALLTDHATGKIDPTPICTALAWPTDITRWAWGEDELGLGSFGLGGQAAPGFGDSLFGQALLGVDDGFIELSADLAEPGLHTLYLQSKSITGQITISFLEAVLVQT